MFEELKRKEQMAEILSKLAHIDTKLSDIDKLLRDRHKPVKSAETQAE